MTETPPGTAERVVVVGGGHAGTTLAGLLRQGGYRGELVLLGSETDLPYQRPPLSKKFDGDGPVQWLRPAEFYREQDITVRLGEQVTVVDRAARRVRTASGGTYAYDVLVLATGAVPRGLTLPGADTRGVITLRTLSDARVLRGYLADRGRLVIVGGGYIGLEVAAAARANGVEVTVVEREGRVLARVASTRFSQALTRHHRARGTDIVTGARVVGLTSRHGHVDGVELADHGRLECDAVLVGVGAVPQDGLARAAGLECDEGIVVDGRARTGDPSVLAIGDATRRPVAGVPGSLRLESIPSATEQARQACSVILGTATPAAEVPWFWSDQFGLKLKIAGVVREPGDSGAQVTRGTAVRGDPSSERFALFHHEDRIVTAVESANAPADFAAGRKFIASRRRVDPARLADPGTPLSEAVMN
ncbi:NAD(P)/FAD-dependent oxidoreductase [Streptomyces sp. NPDC127119]|uniref:NAD(P)/FAD-dependent oxidoreductase n=1 Tax=Streptomyces sp. NPDC127119 TaxID=3345370 RepID=UPI00362B02C5